MDRAEPGSWSDCRQLNSDPGYELWNVYHYGGIALAEIGSLAPVITSATTGLDVIGVST